MEEKEEATEVPKGFYLGEVPTSYGVAIVFNGEIVDANSLLVKIANAVKDAGLLKD